MKKVHELIISFYRPSTVNLWCKTSQIVDKYWKIQAFSLVEFFSSDGKSKPTVSRTWLQALGKELYLKFLSRILSRKILGLPAFLLLTHIIFILKKDFAYLQQNIILKKNRTKFCDHKILTIMKSIKEYEMTVKVTKKRTPLVLNMAEVDIFEIAITNRSIIRITKYL